MKIYSILFVFLFISCINNEVENKLVFEFPKSLKEVSGIQFSKNSNSIWTIEDSGNDNELYFLNLKGAIEKTVVLKDLQNNDWEDLTSDKEGNIYIGDFGNNDNIRKDLAIYKIDLSTLTSSAAKTSYKISFYYPEQIDFPPKKKSFFYDCESFFEYNNNFYLFTKNRSKGFDGTTLMYKIPNKAGNHKAVLLGKFKTCSTYSTCSITSAALSPNAKKMILLSHNQIWLFEDFNGDSFLNGKATALDLDDYSQKEGLCFKDDETIYISDEKTKKIGGNLYQYSINDLKSKP